MRAAERAGDRAFGQNIQGHIGKVTALLGAAGVATGLAGAIAVVKRYAGEAHQEIKGIADGLLQAEETLKRLWTVAGSKKEYAGLSTQMKLAMAREGLGREEAGQLAFTLKSSGLEGEMGQLIQAKRFMAPDLAASFRAMVASTYGRGTFTVPQSLSALDVAAAGSAFDMSQTAKILQETAADLKALGAGPGEILGTVGPLSYQYASPEKLTTGLRAMGKELTKWRETQLAEGRFTEEQLGKGLIGTFDAIRRLDPLYYEQRKLSEIEFAGFARKLEEKRDEAVKASTSISAAFAGGGERFEERIRVPRELDVVQQRRLAGVQREVALERRAEKQSQLQTLIDQAGALAGVYDTTLGVEKFAEDAMQAGARYGLIQKTRELAAERVVNKIIEKSPEVFEAHLSKLFPTYLHHPVTYGEEYGAPKLPPERRVDLPGPMTPEQSAAVKAAVTELVSGEVRRRGREAEEVPAPVEARIGRQPAAQPPPRSPEAKPWDFVPPPPLPAQAAAPIAKNPWGALPAGPAVVPAPWARQGPPAPAAQPDALSEPARRLNEAADKLDRVVDAQAAAADGLNRAAERLGDAGRRLDRRPDPATDHGDHQ